MNANLKSYSESSKKDLLAVVYANFSFLGQPRKLLVYHRAHCTSVDRLIQ